ncbi:MAG TPA: hypothetical protein VNH11_01490 [Pirellulales bacterium]|nr:hypothetical protein [Pirellulales bacterium]
MFYEPVPSERYFERDRKYAEINWTYFPGIVDAFERRIRGWYIEPIEILLERGVNRHVRRVVCCLANRHDGGHYSFAVMAMTCLLIDTLSQFQRGLLKATTSAFKAFVIHDLPSYNVTISPAIDDYGRGAGDPKQLSNIADVLYTGFRCGILHQAHAPLYCGIRPGNVPPIIEPTDHAKYAAGATKSTVGGDCAVVVIYPEHLFDEVMSFFAKYLSKLKDSDSKNNQLRDDFKKKFADSFGIDISGAS